MSEIDTPGGRVSQDTSGFNAIFMPSQIDDAGLSVFAFRLYCHIARRANKENGLAWPGLDSISKTCGFSKNTVLAAITELEKRQMLRVTRSDGGRQSNRYFLTAADKWTKLIKTSGAVQEVNSRGSGCEQPGVQEVNSRGSGGEPEGIPTRYSKEGIPKKGGNPPPPADFFKQPLQAPEDEALPDFPAASMAAAWNRLVPSLAKITGIVGSRARAARARWQELGGTLADWDAFLQRIEASDFLTGRTPGRDTRRFTASFDWSMIPANAHKIREGKYDNPKPNTDEYKPTLW